MSQPPLGHGSGNFASKQTFHALPLSIMTIKAVAGAWPRPTAVQGVTFLWWPLL